MSTIRGRAAALILVLCFCGPVHGFDVAYCHASTPYHCGEQIGSQMKARISSAANSTGVRQVLQWIEGSDHAQSVFVQTVQENRAAHPQVYEEVAGLAAGSGLPLKWLLVINLQDVLTGLLSGLADPPRWRPKQCTDVHAITPEFSGWAHNEDEEPYLDYYLVYANITSTNEQYVGFAYAGTVVGWAWGFNRHGHAHSVNALPVALNATKLGSSCNFVGREVLRATSIEMAEAKATVQNQGTGQHFNIANLHAAGHHLSVETAPGDAHSVQAVTSRTVDLGKPRIKGHYYHVNFYRRLTTTPVTPFGPSSTHRWARLGEMSSPQTKLEILGVMSDRTDTKYPIWRRANEYDNCNTLATVLFDTGSKEVLVYGVRPVSDGKLAKQVLRFDWLKPETWEATLRNSV